MKDRILKFWENYFKDSEIWQQCSLVEKEEHIEFITTSTKKDRDKIIGFLEGSVDLEEEVNNEISLNGQTDIFSLIFLKKVNYRYGSSQLDFMEYKLKDNLKVI